MIFSTRSSLETLCETGVITMDGTFSVCPKFFHQLYTIHGFVHGHYIPLVHCLLPNRAMARWLVGYLRTNAVRHTCQLCGHRFYFCALRCCCGLRNQHAVGCSDSSTLESVLSLWASDWSVKLWYTHFRVGFYQTMCSSSVFKCVFVDFFRAFLCTFSCVFVINNQTVNDEVAHSRIRTLDQPVAAWYLVW